MANRSKKVVLSTRIDGHLKAGLDLLAQSEDQTVVRVIERLVEDLLISSMVEVPFLKNGVKTTCSVMKVVDTLWTEDSFLFKIRIGSLGGIFTNNEVSFAANQILNNPDFAGEFDIYDGTDNLYENLGKPERDIRIDLEKAKEEWPYLSMYLAFLEKNKPMQPSYEEFKKLMNDIVKNAKSTPQPQP
jgi:hypothetical protein